MLTRARAQFDRIATDQRYQSLLSSITTRLGVPVEFRLSETPCFFPRSLMESLVEAAQTMTEQLLANRDYRTAADRIVPDRFRLSHGEALPTCVQVDFGLVRTESGGVEGRLVELQAFPSLYGFQMVLAEEALANLRPAPGDPDTPDPSAFDGLTPYLDGLDRSSYLELMRRVLVGDHDPSHVVLMEIAPERQKTRPDFVATESAWGVRAIDIGEVIRDGRRLFYRRDGQLTPIARIYNRVIPDELERSGVTMPFDYRDDLDVEWLGGPDWFFRISKFSIPWLDHPWVPETRFLSDVSTMPSDRDQWILKPLFSFAGGGILFAPTDADLAAIPDDQRHLYVLQRRVAFTPVIATPHGDTQAELRIMMVRDQGSYRAVMPLVRMGRGKMMGVDHNKGLAYVGASAGLIG